MKPCRWVILLLAFAWGNEARAGDRYFVMVFGSQRDPPNPKYSHTFATFVKATPDGTGCYSLESYTISWLAAPLVVRVHASFAEEGKNLELEQTIRWALCTGQQIAMWGPYETDESLFCAALKQSALLESGTVRYKAVDSGHKTNRVTNCIHAVTSISEGYRVRVASPSWGHTASYLATRAFSRSFIDPGQKHEWIASALGLDQYPISYNELENPRNGAVWTAVKTVVPLLR